MAGKIKKFWTKLNRSQKLVFGLLLSLLILGPVSVAITAREIQIAQLYPVTPPVTPPESPAPSVWPTPSPMPTATPQPSPDTLPVIITTKLPPANPFRYYRAPIKGFDPDLDDSVTMTVTGLPFGLRLRQCASTHGQNGPDTLICDIAGRPALTNRRRKTYPILIRLTDNHGGTAEKILPLTVSY